MNNLRDYQQRASDAVISELQARDSTLIVLPTGTGKTMVGLDVAHRNPGHTLWIAHREELVWQPWNRTKDIYDYNPEIVMREYSRERRNGQKFTIASKDTLWREGRLAYEFPDPREVTLIVCDECFPAGTLVSGRPIESIKAGDLVESYNHISRQVEKRPVVGVMTSTVSSLASIRLTDGRVITCTSLHPFFLPEHGYYCPACQLRSDDTLLDVNISRDDIRKVPHVESVVIHERKTQDEFELFQRLCPGGVVFNLEVKANHNYFANGMLVHNCHHCIHAAKTYQTIIDYFPRAKLLGMTATPDRTDEEALGQSFESVAFDYPLLDPTGAPSAIDDGWLVPLRNEIVTVEDLQLDLVGVAMGDLIASQLEQIMLEDKPLYRMTRAVVDICQSQQTIVFTAGVSHASRCASILNAERKDSAYCIVSRVDNEDKHDSVVMSGDSEARQLLFRRFNRGEFPYLCNYGVATEGYDSPGVRNIVMGRPTKSRSLHAQMTGRCMRVLPGIVEGQDSNRDWWRLDSPEERKVAIRASPKPDSLIVEFAGQTRHALISTVDILGGLYPDDVVARAKAILAADGRSNVVLCLDDAEDQLESEKRARLLAAERRAIQSRATLRRQEVNPFDVLAIPTVREPGWHRGRKPTPKQKAALERFKIPQYQINKATFCQASAMLDALIGRAKNHMATYKQVKLLWSHGIDGKPMAFAQASDCIDKISRNNWKVPPGMLDVAPTTQLKASDILAVTVPASNNPALGNF